jgi:hydroxyacylglutathione hydrolase
MIVKVFPNGPLSVNTYFLGDNQKSIIIDPGHDVKNILSMCRDKEIEISMVWLTHGHLDHIAGVAEVVSFSPSCSVKLHKEDLKMAQSLKMQAQMLMMECPAEFEIDDVLSAPTTFETSIGKVDVVHIGGHSAGSICYVIDSMIFSGDTLFNFAVGRTDLLGSTSNRELINNINNRLIKVYDDETIVFVDGEEKNIKFNYGFV